MSKILIDEATVKLALEALETVNRTDLSQVNLAIAAIKEAQAEQAQQKPFGYIKPGEGDYEKVFSWNRNERNGYAQAVYTTPQPQPAQPAREWVDLTVIEQNELCRELGASRHQVRAIGAKLKEKNK